MATLAERAQAWYEILCKDIPKDLSPLERKQEENWKYQQAEELAREEMKGRPYRD